MQDALANTECNTETTSESSMQTMQDSIEATAPPVAVMVPHSQASDNGQQSEPTNSNPTELEITLANPDLCTEDREFTRSARFKNVKKMVPENGMTAR